MKKGLRIAVLVLLWISFILFWLPFHTYKTSSTGEAITIHSGMFFDAVSGYWAIPYLLTVVLGIVFSSLQMWKKGDTELILLPLLSLLSSFVYFNVAPELFQSMFIILSAIILALNTIVLFMEYKNTDCFSKNYRLYVVARMVLALLIWGLEIRSFTGAVMEFDSQSIMILIRLLVSLAILILQFVRFKNHRLRDTLIALISVLYFISWENFQFIAVALVVLNIGVLCGSLPEINGTQAHNE